MEGTHKLRKITVLILAAIISFGTVFTGTSYQAFAASKPARVTGVKASALSNYSIKVTWKKTKSAKKYQVYCAEKKNGKYRRTATVSGTCYVDSNLNKGTRYYYKIKAVNGSKKGAFSSVKAASTKNSSLYDVTVNKEAKTVTISARVNGYYFNNSTRHFMVDQNGFNKGKAILSSYCTPDDLYNGLIKAGGVSWSKTAGKTLKNGEKNTVNNAENKNFSKLDISVSWGNETHSLSDCLTTEKNGSIAPEIDMIFTGNPKAAAKTPSGCMVCMDSCYIGMAANCAYGLCVIDQGNPTLFA
ncbi:MAG: fibronectin type III domain-containing protein, partial [Mogibacterium sp.]|nr:fibronectin type III domain-containing protein [Mogibacterium sp.]